MTTFFFTCSHLTCTTAFPYADNQLWVLVLFCHWFSGIYNNIIFQSESLCMCVMLGFSCCSCCCFVIYVLKSPFVHKRSLIGCIRYHHVSFTDSVIPFLFHRRACSKYCLNGAWVRNCQTMETLKSIITCRRCRTIREPSTGWIFFTRWHRDDTDDNRSILPHRYFSILPRLLKGK